MSGDRLRTAARRLTARPALPVTVVLSIVAALAVQEGLRGALDADAGEAATVSGWYLTALGAISLVTTVLAARREWAAGVPAESTEEGEQETDGPVVFRLTACLALIAGYIIALPWIGFAATNGAFLLLYLRAVAGYGWLRSLAYAALLDAAFVAFFATVGISLPHGPFRY
ncbi:tripartite tricarboxylate transporter TctB family protein [Streptomyces mayteni]